MADVTGFISLASGLLVSADQTKGARLIADRTHYGQWEQFRFVPLGGAPASVVAIQSAFNGKYVAAEMADGKFLTATRDSIGPWEKFLVQVVEQPSSANQGKFALKSVESGQWVSAEQDNREYQGLLVANRDVLGDWEQFSFRTSDIPQPPPPAGSEWWVVKVHGGCGTQQTPVGAPRPGDNYYGPFPSQAAAIEFIDQHPEICGH